MAQPPIADARLLSAAECGSTSAAAGLAQRDLRTCAERYRELFPGRLFDPATYSTIALANSFCAPWLAAEEMRVTHRVTLWTYGVNQLVGTVAGSAAEVTGMVGRCGRVAAGAPALAADPLSAFLAEIRDELAGAPAYPRLREVWEEEVRRMLVAMAREWEWQAARRADPDRALPTLDAYLDNAVFGFSLVYVTHWIRTTPAAELADIAELQAAGWAVERVIRLLNDIGSDRRELGSGGLTALRLVSREELLRRIAVEAAASRALLAPLMARHAGLALFLERQNDFNSGFHPLADRQGDH
jgi:hypothetical protein